MTTDLKNVTPREARLGHWILLYGILQVLSTLSVDVQGLKHTDGVRYLLCTDLKRCPEWVTNGQTEYLEASQNRSWCWQRSWDPAPTQTAPVELEATPSHDQPPIAPEAELRAYDSVRHDGRQHRQTQRGRELSSPPPLTLDTSLDGQALLSNDIHRINEKINALALSPPARQTITQEYERRRENEKAIQADFGHWKPRFDSLPNPPHPTPASLARQPHTHNLQDFDAQTPDFDLSMRPLPRPTRGMMNTDLDGYPFSPEELVWPVPPGYSESEDRNVRESGIGYSVNGSVYGREGIAGGNAFLDLGERDGRERRSPRRMYERGGW
jgi:hypothetical protein